MSFYSDASLAMIPSGYKDQKVYSALPITGDGDLTFSRASSATRVAANGYIEKVRTNLNLYSQDFTNAAYVTAGYGTRASVVANTTANPLTGAQDADTATFSAGADQSRLLQQFTGLSTTNKYTYSLYVKAGTKSTIKIYGEVTVVGVLADFDLATASVIGTPTLCTASIVSAGSGWYRCSITFNAQGAGYVDCGPVSWAGEDGTLFIYGAQLEVSDFGATDYIATTSAAVSVGPVSGLPRLDYLDSSAPRLLFEPQRTNLWINSEVAASWTAYDVSVSSNTVTSPDGYQSADTVTSNTTSAYHIIGSDNISFTSGTTYSSSVFVKANTGRYVQLLGGGSSFDNDSYANFDLQTGTVTFTGSSATAKIVSYGSGWYRCEIAATATSTANDRFYFAVITTATAARAEVHTTALSYYVWGGQTEAGAYATSYIPTLGTSVTRVADAASKTSIGSLVSTTGTLFVDFVWYGLPASVADNVIISQDQQLYGTTNITISNYNGSLYARINDGLTIVINLNANVSLTSGDRYKVAFAFQDNDFVIYVNGVSKNSSTDAGSVPVTSSIYLQNDHPNAKSINQALVFQTRLSNSDLATLTTL